MEIIAYTGNRLNCIEPDYREWIDVKLIRRMSRIIKMGVASAMQCLKESGTAVPDAIITGTAYGCLEDTGIFLSRMVEQQEQFLAPTAFIQSTHNTVGAQVALLLQCNGYNNVFVHRNFSFEHALLDASMLVGENDAKNVLVGGLDEITDYSHAILNRIGSYRRSDVISTNLYQDKTKGTIAGEGAAFFLVNNTTSENNVACINGVNTFYRPADINETEDRILTFLETHGLLPTDIDLLISGRNGDMRSDMVYDQLDTTVFKNIQAVPYKHLCGEYPTSSAFALWLAVNIIRTQRIPGEMDSNTSQRKKFNKILVYNQSHNTHHSLLLISAC